MAEFFSVNNLGIQSLLADMAYDAVRMPELVEDHLHAIAPRAKKLAFRYSPVDTGFMRDNIFATIHSSKFGAELALGSKAPYTVHVHDGTASMPPRPFLARALADVSKPNGKFVRGLSRLGRLAG